MNRRITILLLLSVLLLTSIVPSTIQSNVVSMDYELIHDPQEIQQQSSHLVQFSSNTALADASVSGTGIAGDPYLLDSTLLEDKEITISNTDAYVILANISLTDSSTFDTTVVQLSIVDASNILITQNEIDFTYNAIDLIRVSNVNITDNNIISYIYGITLGGSQDVHILENTISSPVPIYFTHLERDYSFSGSTNAISSGIVIRDNNLDRGTIDVFFPLKYNPDQLFAYDIANNYHTNINAGITDPGVIIIADDIEELAISNSNIGQLVVRDITNVDIDNATLFGNIWLHNTTSVSLNEITADAHFGYLSNGVTIKNSDTVNISHSNFTGMTKLVYDRFQSTYFQNNTNYPQFYERSMTGYIQTIGVGSGSITNNIINSTGYTPGQFLLINSTNFIFDQNEFIFQSISSIFNPIVFSSSNQTQVSSNSFYSIREDGISTKWNFYVTNQDTITFDANYYSWFDSTDSDNDGYLDDAYLLYNVTWNTSFNLYDERATTRTHDIYNLTITDITTSNGFTSISNAAISNRNLPLTFELAFDNDTSLQTTSNNQIILNTGTWANGTYNLVLNVTSISPVYDTSITRTLNFQLNVTNLPEQDDPVEDPVDDPIDDSTDPTDPTDPTQTSSLETEDLDSTQGNTTGTSDLVSFHLSVWLLLPFVFTTFRRRKN